jgi:hypothetical protein
MMPRPVVCPLFTVICLLATLPNVYADACSPDARASLRNEILTAATKDSPSAEVTCDVTLPAGRSVTKALLFSGKDGNGVTVDCNFSTLDGGAGTINAGRDMIAAAPRRLSATDWERPENIVIKNCIVLGSVRLFGMEFSDLHNSSRCHGPFEFDRPKCAGHTARAQAAAAKNIEFRDMRIVAQGNRTPVYFAVGTTNSKLVNSEIGGRTSGGGVAIYLDAESADNVIRNNVVHVTTERREQLAVDGSAHNLIVGNRFSAIENGAIYLYRNCGEEGIVRHQAPQYNRIINNVFLYERIGPSAAPFFRRKPMIWVGSRTKEKRTFCHFDDGLPFGSGVSDNDFAQRNVIADNRIVGRSVSDAIKADEAPNEYFNNATVGLAASRPSNCYEFDGFPRAYLNNGESSPLSIVDGVPGCHGVQRRCNDGLIETSAGAVCLKSVRAVVPFQCSATGSNKAVQCTAKCPEGFVVESAKSACDLETGSVSSSLLDRQGFGTLEVQRASDNIEEGLCRLGINTIKKDVRRIPNVRNGQSFAIECREHDKNGGDCMISGVLACVRPVQGTVGPARPGS